MTAKQETTFTHGVNEYLPSRVFVEKTHNPYRAGIPDCYYEAVRMKWVEYKFLSRIPALDTTVIVPDLSALQLRWLMRNWSNNHEPWVIVGSASGGVILDKPSQWKSGLARKEFVRRLLSRRDIATAITKALI